MDLVPLDPRARLLLYLQSATRFVVFWLPLAVVGTAVLLFFDAGLGALVVPIVLLFLVFLASIWQPWLAFSRWGYAVGERELLIESGVWFRRRTAIPLGRIQHVDVRQGPIEQWMGLARLQVHTASGIGGDGYIPGLAFEEAERLRGLLMTRAVGESGA